MMGVSSKRATGALITASAILAAPGAALAQDSDGITGETLPPVMVEGTMEGVGPEGATREVYYAPAATTATKTDTPAIETPRAVTTITRRQLDDQNPQSVKDALNYTGGVLSSPDATSRYDSLFMRGFGGFGTSTRIVDYLDGLKLARGQAFALPSIDPFLLDRVEVLKGPAGVLYGETSPGGLVNQVSRAPSAESYNEIRLEGGWRPRVQGGLTSQGAFDDEGQWRYSLSAMGRRVETRYDDVSDEHLAVAPAITWTPTEDTSLTLRAMYQYDPSGGYFNSLYPTFLAPDAYKGDLDRDLNVGDPDFDHYRREQYALGYDFEHRFNDLLSIGSKTRYTGIDLDLQSLQMAAALTADGILARQAVRSIETVGGIATDNHAQFDFSTGPVEHKVLAGVDFQRSESDWEYRWGSAPSLDVSNPQYGVSVGALSTIIDSRQTLQQTGVYLQDQLALGGLRAVFGVRHDWARQVSENRLTNSTSTQSNGSPSYTAGLLYKFDNGLAPYVSYSTSFEPTVGVDISGNPFKPSTADQWEVGLKYEPTQLDALFTVSAFFIRQENVLTPDSTTGFNVQQGEVKSRGVEFEARGMATKNLELIGSFTFQNTEVTESATASTVGKRPQAVPRFHGSAWANYTFDTGLLDGLSLGSGVRFAGSSFADDANTVEVDGYALVDAAARYDLGKVSPRLDGAEVTLNATNILDTEYYSSCGSTYYCQYGGGAQALLGLKYRW